MDELLKACARQRRAEAGPPLEIDPATRNLLQGEVTRTFRRPLSEGSSGACLLPSFWRRLLIGGACVALALVVAGLWLRFDRERELKLTQDRENKLLFFAQGTPEERAPNRDTESGDVRERMRSFELGTAERKSGEPAMTLAEGGAPNQIAPQPQMPVQAQDLANAAAPPSGRDNEATPQAGPLVSQAMKSSAQAQIGATDVPVAKVPALAQSAARYGLALSGPAQTPAATQFASRSQRQGALYFQQIDPRGRYRRNLNSPPLPKVLTTFEVRQTGQNLQVIDADGSVYQGVVEPESQGPSRVLTRGMGGMARSSAAQAVSGVAGLAQRPPQSAPAATPVNAQSAVGNEAAQPVSFAFHAQGTNRTLNQSVVFTGEFEPVSGSVELNQATQTPDSTPTAGRVTPGPGWIQGEASVGGKNQFRIEAQQVGR